MDSRHKVETGKERRERRRQDRMNIFPNGMPSSNSVLAAVLSVVKIL
jgi:hypothetical protein